MFGFISIEGYALFLSSSTEFDHISVPAQYGNVYAIQNLSAKFRIAARHCGEDKLILEKRKEVYEEAKQKNPERWASGKTRNWEPIQEVALNPSKRKEEAFLCEKKSA